MMEMLVAIAVLAGIAAVSMGVLARAAQSYERSHAILADVRTNANLDRQVAQLSDALLPGGAATVELGAGSNDAEVLYTQAGTLLVRRGGDVVMSAHPVRLDAPRACRFDAIGRRCLEVVSQ